MFDNNWNIIIAVLVFVLVISYFGNCYEGFAGTVDAKNAEALGMVSSVYNKDNMSVTNLTATSTITIPGNNKITLNAADGNKILVDAPAGKAPFYINNGINMGCWNTWNINNDGNARFADLTASTVNATGTINSPTINKINERIAALEANTVKKTTPFILKQKNIHSHSDNAVVITDYWLLRAGGTEGANYSMPDSKNFYIEQ